uniref:ATP-dependent DNA helicase n=1 Tax=Kalanchoe fedtschenkoi TaxID=63787 RepID=A0A7N0TM41_KALFE
MKLKFMCSYFSFIAVCSSRSYTTKTPFRTPFRKGLGRSSWKSLEARASQTVCLTDEQSMVLDAIAKKQSVFITGSGGTGKTFLMNCVIERLRRVHGKGGVFVTASTGVAACALNGVTLHSFAGVGLGLADKETLLSRVLANDWACRKWRRAKAVVIDEISMVDAELLDKLEFVARKVRHEKGDKVWGGIQLVVAGDFFQLPPVRARGEALKGYAFESMCWDSSFDLQVELTKVFRQSDDALLTDLLQSVRRGEIDHDNMKILKLCCFDKEMDPSAVRLYPRIRDVKKMNDKMLQELNGELMAYTAVDSGADSWKRQLNEGLAPEKLELRIGARVMLIKNVNVKSKLVNGAAGTVTGFTKPYKTRLICGCSVMPIVKFDSGLEMAVHPENWEVIEGNTVLARRQQIPLVLAWAISIHKCQGMTLDSLQADLSSAFDYGMVYVALSRVKSLAGLHLSGFEPCKIKAHPKVLEFYQRLNGGEMS